MTPQWHVVLRGRGVRRTRYISVPVVACMSRSNGNTPLNRNGWRPARVRDAGSTLPVRTLRAGYMRMMCVWLHTRFAGTAVVIMRCDSPTCWCSPHVRAGMRAGGNGARTR